MALPRFFLAAPLSPGAPLPLAAADVHHLRDVLRLAAGERFVAVAPDGHAFELRLERADAEGVRATVVREADRKAPLPPVTLVQGVCKGEKMDLIVRQAAELGVAAVVPLVTLRTVVRLDAEKARLRRERWRRVAEAAAKQSGRTSVPAVALPCGVADLPTILAGTRHLLVCWEDAAGEGIGEALRALGARPDDGVALVVGPEGGLSAEEVDALVALGARPVSLGATILRTETAATVACALALYELGALGGRPLG